MSRHTQVRLVNSPQGPQRVSMLDSLRSPVTAAPVRYRVEERRRTIFVTSSVPPEHWGADAVNDVLKLAGMSDVGNTAVHSPGARRSTSLVEREVVAFADSPSSANKDADVHIQVMGESSRNTASVPSTPTWVRESPRTPKAPVRERILFYHRKDPHYGFTNFSPHPVTWTDGKRYPTSEHLFQSFKFRDHRPNLVEHIRTCSDRPSVAFSEARRFQPEVCADWMKVNIQAMDEVLWLKFNQHSDLKVELLATGDAELVEDSDKDSFWGVGADHRGRNELGKALERLREKLRST